MEAWLEEMARLAKQHKFQLVLVAFPVSFKWKRRTCLTIPSSV